tara:strand:+ start:2194 stop:3534 length:1341 start_codon:yes stop_codon:yes gene_type:complete
VFNKVLIANRGEIALRIIRACRELGIKTVAVYSTSDEFSLHRKFADEAVCIGPADSKSSYLNIPSIISAAELTDSDAIHPGYGFLSENSDFSKICNDNNISFLGPSSDTIDVMGNKAKAKSTMKDCGVPVVPGSDGIVGSVDDAIRICDEMKFPVMLKASSGGGGKGLRVVENKGDIKDAYLSAQAESLASFNDDSIYVEKYIQNPRHIEIQILADKEGNVVSLGERECSIQRRNQKILEESPSPIVNKEIRDEMSLISCDAVKKIGGYVGAGTIEYLLDKNNDFYFMEMNTRIQVEHPITEMVTGVDLIKNQILSHAGFTIPSWMNSISPRGHSIECRITAEDPYNNFMPSPGKISSIHLPSGMGVRIDTHIYEGYEISPYYDSMIAKIIVHAPTREESINRMKSVLTECVIEGVSTIIPYQLHILNNHKFINGDYDTSFLNKLN